MNFHYRYVGFGSTFIAGETPRTETDPTTDSHRGPKNLAPNELAVDVGGRCLNYDGETLAIFDHHFHRPGGQFPSASAAVLHHAQEIHERFHKQPYIWLVAHREPDFDAYCAMYLARQIISGAIPSEGWSDLGIRTGAWGGSASPTEIDWFSPHTQGLAPERRYPILLAAYASRVDESRRLNCARDRALHAILYAAIHRGRELLPTGAYAFFEEVRRAITEHHLNPLFDSLLDNSKEFAPELALLDRENRSYARDLTRARQSIVYLQESPVDSWYPQAADTPLFNKDGNLNPYHLTAGRKSLRQADAIYIRDPECLLFKEWARTDIENSPSRQGFLFTAIANSNARQSGALNTTSYFFSLDPERAGTAHLYNLWGSLQAAESQAIRKANPNTNGAEPRAIVAKRAAGFEKEFIDPWFDGGNYHCTIIATPNDGSQIAPPGSRADLSDDPITQIARDALELAAFDSNLLIQNIPASCDADLPAPQSLSPVAARSQLAPPPPAYYRFASIPISSDISFQNPAVAEQLGQFLWQLLINDTALNMPADFLHRHLIIERSAIGVWNRKGIAIAYRADAAQNTAETGELLQSLLALTCRIESSLQLPKGERLEAVEKNLADVLLLKQKLALPDFRILARFYEASHLEEVLSAYHALDLARSNRELGHTTAETLEKIESSQQKVEWIEIFLIAVYSMELAKLVTESFESGHALTGWLILLLGILSIPAAIMALGLTKKFTDTLMSPKGRSRLLGIAIWVLLFLLLLFATMWNREPENKSHENPPQTPHSAPHPE